MARLGFLPQEQQIQRNNSAIVPIEFTHAIAIGQTGCGKTTGFMYPNLEHRILNNHAILMFDFKGKEHLSLKAIADKHNRLGEVIEVGKGWGRPVDILGMMDGTELERFFESIMGDMRDSFWINSAVSLGVQIVKQFRLIEKVIDICPETQAVYSRELFDDNYQKASIKTLIQIVSNGMTMHKYAKQLCGEQSLLTDKVHEKLKRAFLDMYIDKNQLAKAVDFHNQLIESGNIITDYAAEPESEQIGKGAGIWGVLITLAKPLMMFAAKPYIFYEKKRQEFLDIVSELNSGKIIVIDTETIGVQASKILYSSITRKLAARTKSGGGAPVSVFIDEAHRILSNETDIGIDVLREAKVELFLAIQSKAQLYGVYSQHMADSIWGNLSRKYTFRNEENNTLKDFEYIVDESADVKNGIDTKIFLDRQELFDTEIRYQQANKTLSKVYEIYAEIGYAVWDSELYLERRIMIMDRSGATFAVDLPIAGTEVAKALVKLFGCSTEEQVFAEYKRTKTKSIGDGELEFLNSGGL